MKVAVIHGPNLNLLGRREPEVYGTTTLQEVNERLEVLGRELGVVLEIFQSNHEGELLDILHRSSEGVDGFLVNAGGLTHTSVVLRDALSGLGLPYVEVHLSNTTSRESFRHRSLLAPGAAGVVLGFGVWSYLLGLRGLVAQLGRA